LIPNVEVKFEQNYAKSVAVVPRLEAAARPAWTSNPQETEAVKANETPGQQVRHQRLIDPYTSEAFPWEPNPRARVRGATG
jgi:hypothetical protein